MNDGAGFVRFQEGFDGEASSFYRMFYVYLYRLITLAFCVVPEMGPGLYNTMTRYD